MRTTVALPPTRTAVKVDVLVWGDTSGGSKRRVPSVPSRGRAQGGALAGLQVLHAGLGSRTLLRPWRHERGPVGRREVPHVVRGAVRFESRAGPSANSAFCFVTRSSRPQGLLLLLSYASIARLPPCPPPPCPLPPRCRSLQAIGFHIMQVAREKDGVKESCAE